MRHAADEDERASRPTWGAFVGWAALGVIAGFCVVSFPTGAIVPIVVGIVVVRVRPTARNSWFGVLTGMGVVSLYVASVQRRGPGTVCWHTATAAGCDEYLDPIPWLVVGSALVVAGLVAHVRRRHAARSVSP